MRRSLRYFIQIDVNKIHAHGAFVPRLEGDFPSVVRWPRIVLARPEETELRIPSPHGIRRLERGDAARVQKLGPESS